MPAPSTPETDDQTRPTAWARPLFERQIAMLGQLAEAGLEMALGIQKAQAADGAAVAADGAQAFMAFARVARATRLTLMLQARLIRDLEAWDRECVYQAARGAADEGLWRDEHALARKGLVERLVGRIATQGGEAEEQVERLCEEAAERLDHDDLYGDVLARPVSELVAMICQDLGLAPDWPQLAQEAWARDEVTSGAAGWPLTASFAEQAFSLGCTPDHAPDHAP
jgi:hypothetical protein